MYWESQRVEARRRLRDLKDRAALTDSKRFEKLQDELLERGYPVDPEADGDFDREDIAELRKIMGDSAKKV